MNVMVMMKYLNCNYLLFRILVLLLGLHSLLYLYPAAETSVATAAITTTVEYLTMLLYVILF